MLILQFGNGQRMDFSTPESQQAVLTHLDVPNTSKGPLVLYLEDIIVSVVAGTVAAFDVCSQEFAKAEDVDPELINSLLRLAVDDTQSYDGVEEFFENFDVRFVP